MRALLTLLVLAGLAWPAHARPPSEAERAALETRLASFEAAIRNVDIPETLTVIPPRVIQTIADNAGLDVEALKAGIARQAEAAFEGIEFGSFEIRLGDAETGELPDGEPYLLIPTTSVITVPGTGTMTTDTSTLAFIEDGTWYLVRVEDGRQISILREAYPGFAGVQFPETTTRMTSE